MHIRSVVLSMSQWPACFFLQRVAVCRGQKGGAGGAGAGGGLGLMTRRTGNHGYSSVYDNMGGPLAVRVSNCCACAGVTFAPVYGVRHMRWLLPKSQIEQVRASPTGANHGWWSGHCTEPQRSITCRWRTAPFRCAVCGTGRAAIAFDPQLWREARVMDVRVAPEPSRRLRCSRSKWAPGASGHVYFPILAFLAAPWARANGWCCLRSS